MRRLFSVFRRQKIDLFAPMSEAEAERFRKNVKGYFEDAGAAVEADKNRILAIVNRAGAKLGGPAITYNDKGEASVHPGYHRAFKEAQLEVDMADTFKAAPPFWRYLYTSTFGAATALALPIVILALLDHAPWSWLGIDILIPIGVNAIHSMFFAGRRAHPVFGFAIFAACSYGIWRLW